MSIVVKHDGRIIWFPALRVGRLFAAELGALEDLVGSPSSFVIDDADEVHLDGAQFTTFVEAMLDLLERTNNPALVALAAGPTQVAVALLHEVTGTWPSVGETIEPMVRGARTLLPPHALGDEPRT